MDSSGFVPAQEVEEHLRQVEERISRGFEHVQARVDLVQRKFAADAREALLRQALSAPTSRQRIFWLRRAADVVNDSARGIAACREGCSHCCYLPAMTSEVEAKLISSEIKQPLQQPAAERVVEAAELWQAAKDGGDALPRMQNRLTQWHLGEPCVFLQNGRCSIYRYRPLVCRFLVNMDVDALLCRLVAGHQIMVPYLNRERENLVYMLVVGPNTRFADIRDWFGQRSAKQA